MKKELIYLLYIATILAFIIFVGNYYFSDKNKKKSYRSSELYENKITKYKDNLIKLDSDTENIVEYVQNNNKKNKKKYNFWNLLTND